jgi:hypothetical protein
MMLIAFADPATVPMDSIHSMVRAITELIGATCFGAIIGWLVYYINRYRTSTVQFSDLVTLMGVIGGGAVLVLFPAGSTLFGAYGIGLAAGFFGYFGRLNVLVARSIKAGGAFTWEWFLDGRRKNPGPGEGFTANIDRPQTVMIAPVAPGVVNP